MAKKPDPIKAEWEKLPLPITAVNGHYVSIGAPSDGRLITERQFRAAIRRVVAEVRVSAYSAGVADEVNRRHRNQPDPNRVVGRYDQ